MTSSSAAITDPFYAGGSDRTSVRLGRSAGELGGLELEVVEGDLHGLVGEPLVCGHRLEPDYGSLRRRHAGRQEANPARSCPPRVADEFRPDSPQAEAAFAIERGDRLPSAPKRGSIGLQTVSQALADDPCIRRAGPGRQLHHHTVRLRPVEKLV